VYEYKAKRLQSPSTCGYMPYQSSWPRMPVAGSDNIGSDNFMRASQQIQM
jgi:hypothetical protein